MKIIKNNSISMPKMHIRRTAKELTFSYLQTYFATIWAMSTNVVIFENLTSHRANVLKIGVQIAFWYSKTPQKRQLLCPCIYMSALIRVKSMHILRHTQTVNNEHNGFVRHYR